MLTIFQALVLGVVEGLTEFLPISSTAHLTLTATVLGLPQSAAVKTVEIAIQSGAILAVLVTYWRQFLDREILARVVIAFIPTGLLGFLFYPLVKNYLLGDLAVTLWALALGGLFLIIFERWLSRRSSIVELESAAHLRLGRAAFIGLVQALALVPGVSRAAAAFVGARLAGADRQLAVEFSFLLAVPTILAATGFDLVKNYQLFTPEQFNGLALAFLAAFFTALFAIRWLLDFVRRRSFATFGFYRLALVLAFLLYLAAF